MTADEIKSWLALVANVRLAVAKLSGSMPAPSGVDEWEIKQAASYLEDAFVAGLEAHGQAVLGEYLRTQKTDAVA